MKKFRKTLLALTLIVSTLFSSISVQAGTKPVEESVASNTDDSDTTPPIAGEWAPSFSLPVVELAVLPIEAETRDIAERKIKEYMIDHYWESNSISIIMDVENNTAPDFKHYFCYKAVHENWEYAFEPEAYNALMQAAYEHGGYIDVRQFVEKSSSPNKVLAWLEWMTYGRDGGGITADNVFSDTDTLTAIFEALSNLPYDYDLMSKEDFEDYRKNYNQDGSGVYYFLVINRGTIAQRFWNANVVEGTAVIEDKWEFLDSRRLCGYYQIGTQGFSSFREYSEAVYANNDKYSATGMSGFAECYYDVKVATDYGALLGSATVNIGKTLWFEKDGLNYYNRGYWGWSNTDVSTNGDFVYSAESSPKDAQSNLSQTQVGTYNIHLKKGVGAINPTGTYEVTINYGTSNRPLEDKYQSITNYTISSGARPASPLSVYAAGTDQSASSYLTGGGGSVVQNGTSKSVLHITGNQLKAWCDGTWVPRVVSHSTANSPKDMLLYQPLKITVSIKNITPGNTNTITCNPAPNGTYVGWNKDSSSNYCSWLGVGDGRDVPFEYHTSYDYKAYAEIIANEVGKTGSSLNADWNAMQGIPSTENLSVAAGGTLHVSDFSGYVHIRGAYNPDAGSVATANAGAGSYVPGVIERVIQIRVNVNDTWGAENALCSLSCPGHTYTFNGSAGPGEKCNVCGVTQPATKSCSTCGGSGNIAAVPPVTGSCTECGGTGKVENDSHTCSLQCSVNCSTGAITGPSPSGSLSDSGSKQQKIGTINFTAPGGATGSITVGDSGWICEGYTTGTGCTPTHAVNCVHHGTSHRDFYIKETLDMFAWKEITDGCVWLLSDAEITAVNSDVISDGALGRTTSSSTGQSTLWRARGYQEGNTNPHHMYGRFWYTQFMGNGTAVAKLGVGCTGVQYTVAVGSGTSWTPTDDHGANSGYHLSNASVVINMTASQKLADAANPSVLKEMPSYSMTDGHQSGHYKSPTCASTDAYKGHVGDFLSDDQITNIALHTVNAWQYCQKDNLFTITVLSDTINNGSHYSTNALFSMDSGYQELVNAIYSVDVGIKLFDCPFTAPDEWHYRYHRSVYNEDTLSGMAYGAFGHNLHDGNAIVGYIGQPNEDPDKKYMYLGQSTSAAKTLACDMLFTGNPYTSAADFGAAFGGNNTAHFYAPNKIIDFTESVQTVDGGAISCISWATHRHQNNECLPGSWYLVDVSSVWDAYTHLSEKSYYRQHKYVYSLNNDLVYVTLTNSNQCFMGETENNKTLRVVSDNGSWNAAKYGQPYVISDIDIKDTAPNGCYSDALQVTCNWRKMLEFHNASTQPGLASRSSAVPDRSGNGSDHFSKVASYSDTYVNRAGRTGAINDIVIHDPISVENWAILGNGYGQYAGYVVDESGEDMRVLENEDGTPKYATEGEKPNYLVMGNTFHLWVSDFGDFHDPDGSWEVGAARSYKGTGYNQNGASAATGEVNPNARGYTDNMNTGKWIEERYVQFGFPVSYVAADGSTKAVASGTMIPLSDVKCYASNGNTDYAVKDLGTLSGGNYSGSLNWGARSNTAGLFHSVKQEQLGYKDYGKTFPYGLDYEFTLLPSASEDTSAEIKYYVSAINGIQPQVHAGKNYDRNGSLAAASILVGDDNVSIVGRIGNLAIEDVGDFRYSELFKEVIDYNSWLIPGVIHNVDSSHANTIIATRYDILGDDCKDINILDSNGNPIQVNRVNNDATPWCLKRFTHAQSSITNNIIGTNYGYGKAGPWLPFPLVASYNPVAEFKSEQMRMGYYMYLDIETMGNYYGINHATDIAYAVPPIGSPAGTLGEQVVVPNPDKLNRGPTSAGEVLSGTDTRKYVMDITPKYFLYDMDTGKFYGINMYYGNQGSRTLFWKNGENISEDITSLYVNMNEEMGRRNTTEAERILTNKLWSAYSQSIQASVFTGEDFIGTASKIRLDTFDKSYIGTTIRNGWVSRNGDALTGVPDSRLPFNSREWFTDSAWSGNNGRTDQSISDARFGEQQQRWYFTLGLPSSTYITYAEDGLTNQARIEESHDRLLREHPNSTVICYLDIEVTGTVWKLKYDASTVNGVGEYPDIIPDVPFPTPENPDDPIPVYGPDDVPIGEIPPEWQPTVVYDPERTSAEDWDTYGTH